ERFARSFPAHDHSTAASVDLNLFLQKSQAPADLDRGACAGAACERLPDTALVHTQTNAVWCHDLHETDIRTIRKARVILYRWPDRVHVRIAHRRDLQHRVGVAHRYRADLKLFLSDPKRIDVRFSGSFERYRLGFEIRHAHLDRDETIIAQFGGGMPAGALHAHLATAQSRSDEARDTACAVAALFDLRAIRIEDSVHDVDLGIRGGQEYERLVEADPGAPVGQSADRLRIRHLRRVGDIEHDEVVAEPVHFREGEEHGGQYRGKEARRKMEDRFQVACESRRFPLRPALSS